MLTQNASPDPIIAQIFVQEALHCGKAAGIDLDLMLSDLGISPQGLDRLHADEFARIWLELSVRMGDEFFGLAKRPMSPGSTTLLGHAVRGARNLDVATRRALRFLRVVLEEPHGVVTVQGGDCTVTLVEQDGPRSAFAYRTFFLLLHGFNCWLARERIPLKSVSFPCAEPAAKNDYGDFFGVPVTFNEQAAQITFDAKYLSRPVNRKESDLKSFLRTTPAAFLRGYRDTGSLKQTIIATCLTGPAQDWPDAQSVAQTLGMSRSTLHRRLNSTGQSLTQLKEELRRNRATALLTRTKMPISKIAAELGYAEESTFYRAFLRWYGTTPNSIRAPK